MNNLEELNELSKKCEKNLQDAFHYFIAGGAFFIGSIFLLLQVILK